MTLMLVYDGGCPFCRHFAERSELAAGCPDLHLLDGRAQQAQGLRQRLHERGTSLARGAILIEGESIWHGAAAIEELCRRMQPGDPLLALLNQLFADRTRAQRLYPLLLLARRLALRLKGLPEDPDQPDRLML